MSESSKIRDRKYVAVLYPEDPTHSACMDKLLQGGYNYAAILHDQDVYEDGEHQGELKKPHWHIVLKFKNAVWNTSVANELGIEQNYLQQCKNVDAALLYLVHYGYDDKAQYDLEKVFGPLQVRLSTLLSDSDESTRVLTIYDMIRNSPGIVTYTEIFEKACKSGLYSDVRRMGTQLGWLINEHNASVMKETGIDPYQQDRDRFDYSMKNPAPDKWVQRCMYRDKQGEKLDPL